MWSAITNLHIYILCTEEERNATTTSKVLTTASKSNVTSNIFVADFSFLTTSLNFPFPLPFHCLTTTFVFSWASLINYGWGFSAGVLLNQTVARRPRSGHTTLCVILCQLIIQRQRQRQKKSVCYTTLCVILCHPKTKTKTICRLYNIVSDPLSTHRLLETKDVAGWWRDDLKIYWPSQPA